MRADRPQNEPDDESPGGLSEQAIDALRKDLRFGSHPSYRSLKKAFRAGRTLSREGQLSSELWRRNLLGVANWVFVTGRAQERLLGSIGHLAGGIENCQRELADFQDQVATAKAIKEQKKKEEKEEAERDRLFNIKKYEDQLEQDRKAKFLKDEKAKAVAKANERLEREMLDHEAMEMARIRRDVEAKEL